MQRRDASPWNVEVLSSVAALWLFHIYMLCPSEMQLLYIAVAEAVAVGVATTCLESGKWRSSVYHRASPILHCFEFT